MLALLLVVVCVAALGILVVAADRASAALAERRARELLAEPLGAGATVRIPAVPFLTQAVRGRYRVVRVDARDVPVGDLRASTLHVELRSVHAPVRALLTGTLRELACERVAGEILLPYAELARAGRLPGLDFAYRDGEIEASASVPVPGLSALARVSGRARLHLDDGVLSLSVDHIAVAGLSVTALVLRQLLPQLSFPVRLGTLPWGLRLHTITPTPAGLLVEAGAAAAVLRIAPGVAA